MLCRASELDGYTLDARDGKIGAVGDCYFDDRSWMVEALVVHTGSGLSDKLVMVPSAALHPANHDQRAIPVDLTTQAITNASPPPTGPPAKHPAHQRGMYAMTGCHIQAADGELGHVEDFVIDDETWMIRYLVVDTRKWWAGKRVLLSPQWVGRVNWTESKIQVALHRDTIEQAPAYAADAPITREYEAALYRHYARERYW